jgi:ABC-type transport system involved in cytochrome c biogenesis permease component
MTFLPIVGRELRVAARKRSTFWVRVSAAIVALVIGGGFLAMTMFRFGFGTASLGKGLFAALTWLSLAAVLSAGLFFTSDCLSEEKRDGTLGLLFLTDLTGYDVVLGKLLATSLRAFYALLAVFPILGITLMMGGVTGVQFWKTALALVNALFSSLAVGLFISAVSRDSQKALAGTLVVMVLLAVVGPVVDGVLAGIRQRPFQAGLALASPGYLFAIAGAWGRAPFWTALLVNQAVAWGLLGLTCFLLPRTWQEKGRTRSTTREKWGHWWKFGGVKHRIRLREKLLGLNPVLWLACRERWQGVALWILSLLVAAFAVTMLLITDTKGGFWLAWSYVGGAVTLVLYLGIASQACRFFVDARRSGLLEVLLVTPLTAKQIVFGQCRALLRMFAVPLVIYLAVQLVAAVMVQESWRQIAAAVPATPVPAATPAATGTNVTPSNTTSVTMTSRVVVVTATVPAGAPTTAGAGGGEGPPRWVMLLICFGSTLVTAANLLALVWFGMWMGLTSKNTNLATLKTMVFVQIIPWFAISFAAGMLAPMILMPTMMTGSPTAMIAWFPLLSSALSSLLYLGKDAGFIYWARDSLYKRFRERAAQVTGFTLPPVIFQPSAPPVPVNEGSKI